jgi:hypothetical protein
MQQTFNWERVQALVTHTIALWHASASGPLPAAPLYTPPEQQHREIAYDEALTAVEHELSRSHNGASTPRETQQRLVALFAQFSAAALDLDNENIALLTDQFLPAGVQLAQWARRFDANLPLPDIVQACRNAWTACGLQALLGKPIRITPSILGYSLLYPYSDNYLDCERLPIEVKLEFSKRFHLLLCGQKVHPRDQREAALLALIELIEGEYPRARFPHVFDCLLAIHRAQEQSTMQQAISGQHDSSAHLLSLSCAKGGASVLTDACLAHCWLSRDEAEFAFEWGVLLQLGDDLQDVREDLQHGSATLFSTAAMSGKPLDQLAIQLLNFGDKVGAHMDRLTHGSPLLKSLLKMSWRSLIIRAVAESHQYFSKPFLHQAEQFSPFRFEFLRARQDRLTAAHGLYTVLFESFLEEEYESTEGRAG